MLLRFLLSGDVHHNTDEVGKLAARISQALATCLDPADGSVFVEQPVFLDVLFSGGDCKVHGRSRPLHVLRMDAGDIFRQGCAFLAPGGID